MPLGPFTCIAKTGCACAATSSPRNPRREPTTLQIRLIFHLIRKEQTAAGQSYRSGDHRSHQPLNTPRNAVSSHLCIARLPAPSQEFHSASRVATGGQVLTWFSPPCAARSVLLARTKQQRNAATDFFFLACCLRFGAQKGVAFNVTLNGRSRRGSIWERISLFPEGECFSCLPASSHQSLFCSTSDIGLSDEDLT